MKTFGCAYLQTYSLTNLLAHSSRLKQKKKQSSTFARDEAQLKTCIVVVRRSALLSLFVVVVFVVCGEDGWGA